MALATGIYDVKRDFGAFGDDSHDDTTSFVTALAVVGAEQGTLLVPKGTYRIDAGALEISTNFTKVLGYGRAFPILKFYGADYGIKVTGQYDVHLQGLRVVSAGANGTYGIAHNPSYSTTAAQSSVQDVHLLSWATCGLQHTNPELFYCRNVSTYDCGRGFEITNADNTDGLLGISNLFEQCRVQATRADGEDFYIDKISASVFRACQALGAGIAAATARFELHGGCNNCTIERLDVENPPAASSTVAGIGLRVSGNSHVISINGYQLHEGIHFATGSSCVVMPGSYSSVDTRIFIDSGSADIKIIATPGSVTDNGTNTVLV